MCVRGGCEGVCGGVHECVFVFMCSASSFSLSPIRFNPSFPISFLLFTFSSHHSPLFLLPSFRRIVGTFCSPNSPTLIL